MVLVTAEEVLEPWAWTTLPRQIHKLKSQRFPAVDIWQGASSDMRP